MSKLFSLLTIASIAIASVSAQAPTSNLVDGACVTNYDASIDYFPQKLNTGKENHQEKKKKREKTQFFIFF